MDPSRAAELTDLIQRLDAANTAIATANNPELYGSSAPADSVLTDEQKIAKIPLFRFLQPELQRRSAVVGYAAIADTTRVNDLLRRPEARLAFGEPTGETSSDWIRERAYAVHCKRAGVPEGQLTALFNRCSDGGGLGGVTSALALSHNAAFECSADGRSGARLAPGAPWRIAVPSPRTVGFGSSAPITTLFTPAQSSASVQGGVLPK